MSIIPMLQGGSGGGVSKAQYKYQYIPYASWTEVFTIEKPIKSGFFSAVANYSPAAGNSCCATFSIANDVATCNYATDGSNYWKVSISDNKVYFYCSDIRGGYFYLGLGIIEE